MVLYMAVWGSRFAGGMDVLACGRVHVLLHLLHTAATNQHTSPGLGAI